MLYGRFEEDKDEDDDKEDKDKDDKKMEFSLFNDDAARKANQPYKAQNVVVEAIYEPPQEADPEAAEGFVVLDDPNEDRVDALAAQLGLRRVGWIFGHPPREAGFQMSAAEVIMAAEYQLEAAGGVEPTPFVSVKVTVGDDGNVSFEAFQVSRQCMEMAAEGALEVGPNPGFCYVNPTFTAIQEGKESKTVENNFFLAVVPIKQHTSEMLLSDFPKANRDMDDRLPSKDEMKRQLGKSGSRAGRLWICWPISTCSSTCCSSWMPRTTCPRSVRALPIATYPSMMGTRLSLPAWPAWMLPIERTECGQTENEAE